MKLLIIVLVALNLALLAMLGLGVGGRDDQGRDPRRLSRQVHPERMRVVEAPAGTAPADRASAGKASGNGTAVTSSPTSVAGSPPSAAPGAGAPGSGQATSAAAPSAALPAGVSAPGAPAQSSSATGPATSASPVAGSAAATPAGTSTSAASGASSPSGAAASMPATGAAASTPATGAAGVAPPSLATAFPACTEWGPFSEAELPRARAALEAAAGVLGVEPVRRVSDPKTFMAWLPPAADQAAAQARAAELKRAGIDSYVLTEGPHRLGISLGTFRQEEGARAHVAEMQRRGLADAQVLVRGTERWVLRLGSADPAPLAEWRTSFGRRYPNRAMRACAS